MLLIRKFSFLIVKTTIFRMLLACWKCVALAIFNDKSFNKLSSPLMCGKWVFLGGQTKRGHLTHSYIDDIMFCIDKIFRRNAQDGRLILKVKYWLHMIIGTWSQHLTGRLGDGDSQKLRGRVHGWQKKQSLIDSNRRLFLANFMSY